MNKKTTEEFISDSIKKHGDTYDYSLVEYKRAISKVVINCHVHGTFSITPNSHLNGSGCYHCGRVVVDNARKLTTEQFIKRSIDVHNDLYSYDKSIYVGYKSYIIITCRKHGDFKQKVIKHLNGQGCSKCRDEGLFVDFISMCKDKFVGYSYNKVNYKGMYNNVIITCDKHGDFSTRPVNFYHKEQGCKLCINRTISKPETKWLDSVGVSQRNIYINVGGKTLCVDGYDDDNNIIYEFYGDYFHGNPDVYDRNDINKRVDKTFGELYDKTIEREKLLTKNGYTLITMWENDFK